VFETEMLHSRANIACFICATSTFASKILILGGLSRYLEVLFWSQENLCESFLLDEHG